MAVRVWECFGQRREEEGAECDLKTKMPRSYHNPFTIVGNGHNTADITRCGVYSLLPDIIPPWERVISGIYCQSAGEFSIHLSPGTGGQNEGTLKGRLLLLPKSTNTDINETRPFYVQQK